MISKGGGYRFGNLREQIGVRLGRIFNHIIWLSVSGFPYVHLDSECCSYLPASYLCLALRYAIKRGLGYDGGIPV